MGKNRKRKTPPNELIDRYKREKDRNARQEQIDEEQKQIDEEQKQIDKKAKRKEKLKAERCEKRRLEEEKKKLKRFKNKKRKDKKYVTVIVQNDIRETRKKFRVELQKNVEKEGIQNPTKSKKAENYYQRTYNQLLADRRRNELLKTITEMQEDELGER